MFVGWGVSVARADVVSPKVEVAWFLQQAPKPRLMVKKPMVEAGWVLAEWPSPSQGEG